MTKVHTPLDVHYVDGRYWVLHQPFVVELDAVATRVTVPAGFVFDFNSIPRFFWRLAPPTEYGEAGLVHDYLYRKDCTPNVKREYADQAHRELMQWKKASGFRAGAFYRALRLFGGGSFHQKDVAWKPEGLTWEI